MTRQKKGSTNKTWTPVKRKQYVLEHLGTMTNEQLANRIECGVDNVYKILQSIREERDLIHHELIQTSAEEQFNRLNNNTKLSFNDLMSYRKKVQDKRQVALSNGDPEEVDDSKMYTYNRIYIESERELTKFLKGVGLYNPEILVQNIENQNSGPVINVSFPEGMQDEVSRKKLKEVNKRGKE